MQKRVTTPGSLHDEQGNLIEVGYATELVKTYDRNHVAARRTRIKEWDYYAVVTDRFALALTIDHNGYMVMDSISLLDFQKNTQITKSAMGLPFMNPRDLPPSSAEGDIAVKGKNYMLSFENDGYSRRLVGHMNKFSGNDNIVFDLHLTDAPKETMVIITPYKENPKAFYYNQKINCMRVEGMKMFRDGNVSAGKEN